ncbi:MAG: hypothetical protein Q8P65_00570 [bacterium]|nr:hypothetical protein [bacterium]
MSPERKPSIINSIFLLRLASIVLLSEIRMFIKDDLKDKSIRSRGIGNADPARIEVVNGTGLLLYKGDTAIVTVNEKDYLLFDYSGRKLKSGEELPPDAVVVFGGETYFENGIPHMEGGTRKHFAYAKKDLGDDVIVEHRTF